MPVILSSYELGVLFQVSLAMGISFSVCLFVKMFETAIRIVLGKEN